MTITTENHHHPLKFNDPWDIRTTTMGKVKNVNSHDIRDAIRLGCRTMGSVFNHDDQDIPFFCSSVRPEVLLAFSPLSSEAHVPGRHLNALLNAEDAAGIRVSEEVIEKHARAAFFSYSGTVPLPLNRNEIGGPLVNIQFHNLREGFHALYALTKFRSSVRARELAEASIAAIGKYWDPVNGWSHHLEKELGLQVMLGDHFIGGLGRSIGPLVKFYRSTGYKPALELALLLKEKATSEFFTLEGRYNPALFGTHIHSITSVMSSLAQLADLTSDTSLLTRVKAFYDHGLRELRDELGWSIMETSPSTNPDRGEANNTGDIVETALILGRRGYSEYYQDAEQILRGHLLPCQLRDTSFIQNPLNPNGEDGKRDVADRHLGAFGFPAPYGHEPVGADWVSFNMDVVGGVVGSLCEAYREVTRFDQTGHWVNLLFDHETPAIGVRSPYTHPCLCIQIKKPGSLHVRIPPWVRTETIKVDGAETPLYANGFFSLAQPPVGRAISFQWPLPVRELTLKHATRPIRVRLRGDEVTAMDSFGAGLTFWEDYEKG